MSLGYSPVLQPLPPCSHSPSSAHVSFKDTCHWIKVHRVFPSEPTFTGLGPMLLKPHPAHTHPPRDLLTREPPDGARWPWAHTMGSDHQSMRPLFQRWGNSPGLRHLLKSTAVARPEYIRAGPSPRAPGVRVMSPAHPTLPCIPPQHVHPPVTRVLCPSSYLTVAGSGCVPVPGLGPDITSHRQMSE